MHDQHGNLFGKATVCASSKQRCTRSRRVWREFGRTLARQHGFRHLEIGGGSTSAIGLAMEIPFAPMRTVVSDGNVETSFGDCRRDNRLLNYR